MHFIIGSRGSKLALWQAEWVRGRLLEAGDSADIKIITTTGDRMTAAPLALPAAKGLFIKEIEEALLAGNIDIAVHSFKDLPVDLAPSFTIAAVPEREDARDALVTRSGGGLESLIPGASVGTGSPRRESQLRALRPDLAIVPMRGNVDTRIRKLDRGDCDAIVMAAAGLHRLGLKGRIAEYFDPSALCPAAGQGAMAVEIRHDDARAATAVRPLDHAATCCATLAERAALRRLGGGCQMPIAAYASVGDGSINICGAVATADGTRVIRARAQGAEGDPEAAGARLAEMLIEQGAAALLRP